MSETASYLIPLLIVTSISFLIGYNFPQYPYITLPSALALGFFVAPAIQKLLLSFGK